MADKRVKSSSARDKNPFQLPSEYKFLKVLGEGGFGTVLQCLKKDTEDIVAVKISKDSDKAKSSKEVSMMKDLKRCLDLDQCNIVKFYDCFKMSCGKALVFETLNITMVEYISKIRCVPMLLSDIRVIIKQLATALDALKSVSVIHTDIHLSNIMLVDQTRPFRVKLIDFGNAIPRSEAKRGMTLQTLFFRSPEIILGLPFSEAIDMWSLGCGMAAMLLGIHLFQPKTENDALQFLIELLGQPPGHLLNKGKKTRNFFYRTGTNGWRLKTCLPPRKDRKYIPFHSLNDIKQLSWLWNANKAEANDPGNCIELLKAMLKMDEAERITPSDVLTHPFIVEDHHNSCNEASGSAAAQPSTSQAQTTSEESMEETSSDDSLLTHVNKTSRSEALPCVSEHFDWDPPAPALKEDDITNIHSEHHSPSSTIPRSVEIMVRPATANNSVELEDQESATSLLTHVNKTSRSEALPCVSEHFDWDPPAPALKEDDITNIHSDHHSPSSTIPRSVVIMVRPATANNSVELEDQESATSLLTHVNKTSRSEALPCVIEHFDCNRPAPALKEDDTTNIHPDHYSPSPTIPGSVVIMVRPATANNRMELEDQETATSLLTHMNKTSRSEALPCVSEHFDCDPPAPALKEDDTTNIHPDHYSPSPTIPGSVVIMVRPATANNSVELEDQESATSLQAGLNKMPESSLKVIESDTMTRISEVSTTSDDTGSTMKKQKKKKNCFRRFFSWMKKNLCCCCTCVEEDEEGK